MALDKSRLTLLYEKWVKSLNRNEEDIVKDFSMCITDTERANVVNELVEQHPIQLFLPNVGKNNSVSKTMREMGNEHYKKKVWDNAMKYYSKSIAYAVKDSQELAMALGNRAACLLNLGFIAEALVDVSRALNIRSIDDDYVDKLNSRKNVCMARIIETKEIPPRGEVLKLGSKSSYFECSTSKVELKENETMGRFIAATDDINTGEVLAVEKPYSSVLLSDAFYGHCAKCFHRSIVLIECPDCTVAMYCSTDCLNNHKNVHKFECPILEHFVGLECGAVDLLAIRLLITVALEGTPIGTLTKEMPQDEMYRSMDIRRVFNLVGNGNKRDIPDLFRRGFVAAALVKALKEFTTFFNEFPITESEARGFVFHFLQSLPCNAHEVTSVYRKENNSEIIEIGGAVYSTLSLINHSCNPNVVRQSFGDCCILRAIRPIQSGEELFDNYGYHYAILEKKERQRSLERQYYFKCECNACMENWPVYNGITMENFKCEIPQVQEIFSVLTTTFWDRMMALFDQKKEKKASVSDLDFFCYYMDFLNREAKISWPCKIYNDCQECIKFTLDFFEDYNRG